MMATKNREKLSLRWFLVLGSLFFVAGILLFKTQKLQSAGNLTGVSATLSNSRLSFSGQVGLGTSAGATVINLKTTGNIADKNTNNLFPGDTVSVGLNGNKTVGSIVDADTFILTDTIDVSVAAGDTIYSTQSGALTVVFTITNDIPAGGYVLVTIPDSSSNQNDGAPDTEASTTLNGFDLNGMAVTDISTTGGTDCTWGTETLTAGTGSGHTYKVVTTTTCTAGTITVTFDGATKDLVNPAPIYTGHTQGLADTYTIDVTTYDSSAVAIDTAQVKVAPVEAVLVSATVDETLSFQIAGVAAGTTACGQVMEITTNAYSVPWGTLSTANSFYQGAQTLTVSTNADAGYTVKTEENDQMGLGGTTCDVPANATADETDNPPCIKDYLGVGTTASEAGANDWTTATYNGLGFSMEDLSGTDAVFDYNGKPAETSCTSGTFCARQIADQQASETKATIMSNGDSVSSSQAYVCYQISISATQPAGYYYNKVKYTCTATF